MPELSIIMPVYNQEKYIVESVKSILHQTYKDFELLIINDGSTDNTKTIVNNFSDERIKLIDNENNKGIIYSLNKGLELAANSRFIGRMDGDDIALENRFQTQVDFMNQNKHIGLTGSSIKFFGARTRSRSINYPPDHKKIMSSFLCLNPFAHPTVMFRSSLLNNNAIFYNTDFPRYEDYAMWMNFINKTKFANIDEVLLHYRRHPENVTSKLKKATASSFPVIQKLLSLYFKQCEINLTNDEVRIFALMLSNTEKKVLADDVIETILHVKYSLNKNAIDNEYLNKILYRCFLKSYPHANYVGKAEQLRKKLGLNINAAVKVWKSLMLKNSFPD